MLPYNFAVDLIVNYSSGDSASSCDVLCKLEVRNFWCMKPFPVSGFEKAIHFAGLNLLMSDD